MKFKIWIFLLLCCCGIIPGIIYAIICALTNDHQKPVLPQPVTQRPQVQQQAAQQPQSIFDKAYTDYKKCPNCGADIEGKFCPQCGTQIK